MKHALNILYLENNKTDIETVRQTLVGEEIDFNLIPVDTKEGFTSALKNYHIDLILSAYNLPLIGGIEALKIKQTLCSETPFIFFSGRIGEELAVETIKKGATDYVLKQKPRYLAPAVKRAVHVAREKYKRLLAEKALEKSEAKFRTIIETTSDLVWEVNSKGVFTYANLKILDILGYRQNEVIGKSLFDFISENEKKRAFDLLEYLSRNRRAFRGWVIDHIHKNGEIITIEISGIPILTADNRHLGWRGFSRNITKRIKAEKALRIARDNLEERVKERTVELTKAINKLAQEIETRRQAEESLKKSQMELRSLSNQILEAYEKESKRIGAELHDGIAQTVSALKMKADVALIEQKNHDDIKVKESLESIIHIAQTAIEEIRRISSNLRPSMLDNLGIIPTISWLCREFENTYPNIKIKDNIEVTEEEISHPLKTVVFRVLQESLNNVAKHSQADIVRLSLKRKDGSIAMIVEDNGTGFDKDHLHNRKTHLSGLGLPSMRERTELSNGTFLVITGKGTGTKVQASWPVN